jgi:hypothetical protein
MLTLCLDLSPDQAAAAMRESPATRRRRLAEARSALRAVLLSETLRPAVLRPSAFAVSQASFAGTRHPAGHPRSAGQSWAGQRRSPLNLPGGAMT